MSDSEKQVEQLLTNAKQALNFLRTVLDDLIYRVDEFTESSKSKILFSQEKYKKNKAVLTNIEKLLQKSEYPLPRNLTIHVSRNLRERISAMIEEAITLDRLR